MSRQGGGQRDSVSGTSGRDGRKMCEEVGGVPRAAAWVVLQQCSASEVHGQVPLVVLPGPLLGMQWTTFSPS